MKRMRKTDWIADDIECPYCNKPSVLYDENGIRRCFECGIIFPNDK